MSNKRSKLDYLSDHYLHKPAAVDPIPPSIRKIRKAFLRMPEEDTGAYRAIIKTYKKAMIDFVTPRKPSLRAALGMMTDDVREAARVTFAAAAIEVTLAVLQKTLRRHPKLALKALRILEADTTKAMRHFVSDVSRVDVKKQIKLGIEAAEQEIKLAAKRDDKQPANAAKRQALAPAS